MTAPLAIKAEDLPAVPRYLCELCPSGSETVARRRLVARSGPMGPSTFLLCQPCADELVRRCGATLTLAPDRTAEVA